MAGVRDGNSRQATFSSPQGMAYDAKGNLFVADTTAQRIREIDTNGIVRTVAGSGAPILFGTAVAGGYQDGRSSDAQFNMPQAVAIATDGTIYVADAGNHCIRRIKNGLVTTVAGDLNRIGGVDGTRSIASFSNPRGIALDRAGDIFVADTPNGIRRIAADGTVSTLKWKYLDAAWSVATYENGTVAHLMAVTPRQIAVYDLHTEKIVAEIETEQLYYLFPPREGAEFLGPPSSVTEISPTEFVFADNLLSTIHLVQLGAVDQVRVLSQQPLLNAANREGGFRDGPGDQALFDQPMGIASSPTGEIAVADTGNKRIRLLSRFNRHSFARDGSNLPDAPDEKVFRVAIVGNSYVWTNVPWHRSLAGILEQTLTSSSQRAKKKARVEVYPIRQDGVRANAEIAYAQQMLTNSLFNYVVVMVPTYGQFTLAGDLKISTDPPYTNDLKIGLTKLGASMKGNGQHLLVVLFPGAFDMQNEMSYRKFFESWRDPGEVQRHYLRALAAVRSSGADYLDLWPRFYALDASATNKPIFGAWDHHFTYFGNAIVAKALAAHLLAGTDF